MVSKSRSILLATGLMAFYSAAAIAQSNNPAGNMGSNNSATASPGTADSKPARGMNTGDAGSAPVARSNAATNSNAPGGTGTTVVPGSNSSQAGSAAGTAEMKTGGGGQK
jgi:hypothetical protein